MSTTSSSPPTATDFSRWAISRQPGSVISFASFDPATATGDYTNAFAFRKLTLNEELCRPKRVVIETAPNGQSTWRFVPKARWETGVDSEGTFPRLVDVCGEVMDLTHDEWDMYKLDRRFDCLVRLPPNCSVITKLTREPSVDPIDPPRESANIHESPLRSKNVRSKRRLSDVSIRSGSNSDGAKKKSRAATVEDFSPSSSSSSGGDNEAEEDEVNRMVVDGEGVGKKYQQSERLKKVQANIEEAKRKRQECNARKQEERDENMMSWTEIPIGDAQPKCAESLDTSTYKRKFRSFKDERDISEDSDDAAKPRFKPYEKNGSAKRKRTVSPGAARRAVEQRRNRREIKRKEELDRRNRNRAEDRRRKEAQKLYEETAQYYSPPNLSSNGASTSGSAYTASSSPQQSEPEQQPELDEEMDEEAQRQAMLEESRRKMAELEKDRHLWEEAARRRAAEEAEEKARAEASRTRRAASQAAAAEQEEQRAQRRAEQAAQHERDTAADVRRKRAAVRDTALHDARIWLGHGWSVPRALERYKEICDAFDRLNFSKGDVVVFETVPWPVLLRPGAFGVEDVDWTAVETFFRQVRVHLSLAEYVQLVEKSHKRFHPDRWRSRRVLHCVEDEEEKECLKVAANTVAQALTPLWQEVTGR